MAQIIDTADLTEVSTLSPDVSEWVYNGLDCCVTMEIFQVLAPQLDDLSGQVYSLSRALQAPVLDMAMRGVLVNQNRRQKVMFEFRKQLVRLEAQLDRIIQEGIGVTLNWRSPTQLSNLLYNVMCLPVQKKRNSNGVFAPTTNRDALEKLSVYFIAEPVINHLLLLRDLGKALGFLATGIDADGRIRTSFNIAGTNTGRFSSSESDYGTGTNLQNVDRELRAIFTADPGYKFANLDLEQADSRNIGANCWNTLRASHGDRFAGAYLDACEGGDLHTTVAKMALHGLPWGSAPDRQIADQIFYRDKSYRDVCKVLGHGSNYLGTPPTMSKHSKLPVKIVKEFQDDYFKAFPCIPAFHQWVFKELGDLGSLTTFFGRRRVFWGRPTESSTRREAVAYMGQSPTADAINHGILNLWRWGRVQLLVQVHDSILFQYPEEEEDEIIPKALELLRVPVRLSGDRDFVIPTEAQVGWNWGYYNEKDNPDGMRKYKGHDTRRRVETDFKLTIRGL